MTRSHASHAELRQRRRRAADRRLRRLTGGAVVLAVALFAAMLAVLLVASVPALTRTTVRVGFDIDPALVSPADPRNGDFRGIVARAALQLWPEAPHDGSRMLTQATARLVRQAVLADPALIGTRLVLDVPAADPYDRLAKGLVDRTAPDIERRLSDEDISRFDRAAAAGLVARSLNIGLLTRADSRLPEMAGLGGAFVGTVMTLGVCLLVSLPVGIGTAIFLEEFAARARPTALIKANVNHLAAVPPILFGLLGLAVLISGLGMPRSSPLVAGLVLGLMTLPTVVIFTRRALARVPATIREAGFALGASRHQVVRHHVLPLALPGVLAGAVIALAQALGEAAPLLLIGMNAFISSVPDSVTGAATTLPTQILLWAGNPETGFVSRAAAAVLVLILLLITLNGLAMLLRHRFERR